MLPQFPNLRPPQNLCRSGTRRCSQQYAWHYGTDCWHFTSCSAGQPSNPSLQQLKCPQLLPTPAVVLYRSSSPNEWQVPPFHCVAMVHDRHLASFMCSTSHGDECMRDTLRCAINLCLLIAAPREVIAVKAPSDRNFAPSITT